MTEPELRKATKALNIINLETECAEYEDRSLSSDARTNLFEAGIHVEDPDWVGPEDWVNLVLACVKHENPSFNYEIVTMPTLPVGGYGLFY